MCAWLLFEQRKATYSCSRYTHALAAPVREMLRNLTNVKLVHYIEWCIFTTAQQITYLKVRVVWESRPYARSVLTFTPTCSVRCCLKRWPLFSLTTCFLATCFSVLQQCHACLNSIIWILRVARIRFAYETECCTCHIGNNLLEFWPSRLLWRWQSGGKSKVVRVRH